MNKYTRFGLVVGLLAASFVAHAEPAKVDCKMKFTMSGWSVFYKRASGTGTITCNELGDCATDVTIGVFEAPGWPVEGGSGNQDPVFSETKTLDDVL